MEYLERQAKESEPVYEHKELIEETQFILSEASFSKAHIEALKKAYGGIKKIDPDSEAYKKLITMLNGLPDNQLKTLAKSDVPFVSALARNRVISRGLKMESLEIIESKKADSSLKTGDVVKITKSARQDVVGGKNGITLGGRLGRLSAESQTMMIRKITKTKDGRKAHMVKADGSLGGGYAIMLDDLPDFMSVEKISVKEDFDLDEASGYTINHKTFSSAVQHAIDVAEKRGFQVDDDDWDRKVAMGPRKPSSGKTNMYSINLMKNGKDVKQKLNMQVYYDEGRYELNMYIQ